MLLRLTGLITSSWNYSCKCPSRSGIMIIKVQFPDEWIDGSQGDSNLIPKKKRLLNIWDLFELTVFSL
jgi:hypothetical protein